MLGSALSAAILARLSRLLATPTSPGVTLWVDGQPAGFVVVPRVARLAAFSATFDVRANGIHFAPALTSVEARTAAMAEVTAALAAEGALSAWRDERYAVRPTFTAAPWFLLERAAARYFGIHTYAAHINGLSRDRDIPCMWLARRSPGKAIDPGLLDNLVGGGIRAGASVASTVIAEAWEEAGITAELAATARQVGTLVIRRDQPDGLQSETIFVHDLDLAPAFVPANQDGEVTAHRRVEIAEAARLIALEAGPDVVTADASLVVVDYLLRQRAFADDDPPLPALRALRGTAAPTPSTSPSPSPSPRV